MYKPIICLLLATACMAAPFGFDLTNFEQNLHTDIIHTFENIVKTEKELFHHNFANIFHHLETRNTGKDLLKALEGTALNKITSVATGAVGGIVTKIASGLIGKLTGVLTGLLGHLGKRSAGKDLLKALEGSAINSLTGVVGGVVDKTVTLAVGKLTGLLTSGITNLFSHIGKRNTGKDLLKALEGSAINSLTTAVGGVVDKTVTTAITKLTDVATGALTNLFSHFGKRDIDLSNIQNVINGMSESFAKVIHETVSSFPQILEQEIGPIIAMFTEN